MAKKDSKSAEARVLVAGALLSGVVVVPGQVVVGLAEDIKAWADSGQVDPHPDAIAYAKAEGAQVVDLTAAAPKE
jgi:hypothetical protein